MATRIVSEGAAFLTDVTTGRVVGFRNSDGSSTFFATRASEDGGLDIGGQGDTIFSRESAGIASLKNGTTAQELQIFKTSSGADSEYASFGWSGSTFLVTSGNATGAGTPRGMAFYAGANGLTIPASGATALGFVAGAVTVAHFSTAGVMNFTAATATKPHINFAPGVAPTSPANGDFWVEASDIKVRLGGVTYTLTKS